MAQEAQAGEGTEAEMTELAVIGDEYECPRCRTVYFEPKDSCDWCPDVVPVLIVDFEREE
jgi:hypothetical protein